MEGASISVKIGELSAQWSGIAVHQMIAGSKQRFKVFQAGLISGCIMGIGNLMEVERPVAFRHHLKAGFV